MIRFYNGKILTMEPNRPAFDGEVWVDGEKISYVGPAKDEMPEFDREVDLKGDLLMPSFKNAHTHSAMTFLRSYADDLPLHEWLYNRVFPMEAKLTPEHVYEFTRLAVLEYLTSGITASFDMYYHSDAYTDANIDSGFRSVLCGAMNDFDARPEQLEDDFVRFNKKHPLIGYRIGFHAEYTTGMERLKYVAELAKKYRAPVFVHNSETKSETEECVGRYGLTPTALFDSLGIYDYGGGGYHCVWFNENDMDIFARRGLWAVTNPCSNAKLASGIAPITRMMEKGVNLAIGTDGAASNNALDMFREMYLCCVMQKIKNEDASSCDADKVLEMATVGSARAMGLDDCDIIGVGKQADMIIIDLHRPNMQPIYNITKNIVYSGSKENVRLTMIAGKILYENGEFFIGEDPYRIYEKCAEMAKGFMEA